MPRPIRRLPASRGGSGSLAVSASLAAAWPWLKAAHIVSVMAWMAGLLYLPRLFVYHCEAAAGSEMDRTFRIMERRLYRAVATPAMLASWAFGALLLAAGGAWGTGWFFAKLALVLGMTAMHGFAGRWRREFAEGRNRRSARFYRIANEVPAALLLAIVVLAVAKPF